jgi:hypothetical protein
VAGRIVEPAAAKLQPFLKFGKPNESKYAFKNGKSNASTANNNQDNIIRKMKRRKNANFLIYGDLVVTKKINDETAIRVSP